MGVVAILCLIALTVTFAQAGPPNILLIYADDLGYGETGVQGCKDIPTPNIDSIANNGVRCTQGYVAATYCSPSRAGLLTGKYPTRFGHEFNAITRMHGLSLSEKTLADRLRSEGYATAIIGKWHLGNLPKYRPNQRGFDEFYGTLGNTPFYHPTNFIDTKRSDLIARIEDPEFYTTDKYAERALDWLERNQSKPWFLYLPFNAQHAPLQAPQKYLDRFPNIADEKRKMFAAMMAGMDDAIGRVLEKIRSIQQEENTLIFFIADNGGPTQSTTSRNAPLRGFKMTTFEGGPRVPFFVQWKGHIPAGKTYGYPVMNLDVLPTCMAALGKPVESNESIDGVDIVPFLRGDDPRRPHTTMYWRFGEQWAVRHGDWKLVVSKGGSGSPELYNLAEDVGERNNLSSKETDRVLELQKLFDTWNGQQAEPTVKDEPAKPNAKKTKSNKAA
ncbi:MAG: sulfatase [Planctomycetes bacterium]|nr:sulfatase [Planctomycetota bacterium]